MPGEPTPAAPGDPAGPTDAPTSAPIPTLVIQPDDSETLGGRGSKEAVLADLAAERDRRQAAEKGAKDLQSQLDKLNKERMTEQERAVAEAREEGRLEALKPMHEALARAEMKAAAKGVLADPTDAARYLNSADYIDNDGKVDDKAIDKALALLIKERPHLKAGALPTGPGSVDGGSRASAPTPPTMNDLIRAGARRGGSPAQG